MDDNKINLNEYNEVLADLIYTSKPEAFETEMTLPQSALEEFKDDGRDFESGHKVKQ